MIRELLATWCRHRARAGDGQGVDTAVFLGAQLDVRDAQIEGLRDALAELERQAAAAKQRTAVLEARLARYESAELMRRGLAYYMAQGRRRVERVEDEPTVRAPAMGRATPGAAPTERWGR